MSYVQVQACAVYLSCMLTQLLTRRSKNAEVFVHEVAAHAFLCLYMCRALGCLPCVIMCAVPAHTHSGKGECFICVGTGVLVISWSEQNVGKRSVGKYSN